MNMLGKVITSELLYQLSYIGIVLMRRALYACRRDFGTRRNHI